ncbi:MAG: hypothetical protein U0821_25095 [Chloroflexota bacterium]
MSTVAASVYPRVVEAWKLRCSVADSLSLAEEQLRSTLETASVAELTTLLETYTPGRSGGPAYGLTFIPLVERLWRWCSTETIAELHAIFAARGMPWAAVANALAPENGTSVNARVVQLPTSKLPSFTLS